MKHNILRGLGLFLAPCSLLLASCADELDVQNPNMPTTEEFGRNESDLQKGLIATYNRLNLDGCYARVGYTLHAVMGDEVWNASQVWYKGFDDLNIPATDGIVNWSYREFYQLINHANLVLDRAAGVQLSDEKRNEIEGQAKFLRGLGYYELATYYQTAPLVDKYSAALSDQYKENSPQEDLMEQARSDFEAALVLPKRDAGGEWAQGRVTCGAAAGYLARVYMWNHQFDKAYDLLKDIIGGKYGSYDLVANYGDNFMEGAACENNVESLFEVQFMDYGTGGSQAMWIGYPNVDSSQGHAVGMNYGPQLMGNWGDLAGTPWLYNLFKKERCTDGRLDPRLYWTLMTYESEYDAYNGAATAAYPNGDPRCNNIYNTPRTNTPPANGAFDNVTKTWNGNGGISLAKWTYARANTLTAGAGAMLNGINIRLLRFSEILLLAAEASNELSGPNSENIGYINRVRQRVGLPDLQVSDFASKDALFEQIANVERPKEFGGENCRNIDLIRWGFYYDQGRLDQLKRHAYVNLMTEEDNGVPPTGEITERGPFTLSSFDTYTPGHEYMPITQKILDTNPSQSGNSANKSADNGPAFKAKGWTIHPVVE